MARARATQALGALQALSSNPDALRGPEATAALRDALTSRDRAAISSACKLIAEHTLSAHGPLLAKVFHELATEHVSADLGCLAKEALLVALDAIEYPDPELFAGAAWYVQLDKAKGGPRDSAGRVRARAVQGLARLGHADLLVILGARLADDDPTVRLAAANALAHRGQRDGAGLLLLKLGAGDQVEAIVVECLRGLFVLVPELAVVQARTLLQAPRMRDAALQALGTAAHEDAVALLREELARATFAAERKQLIEALSLNRRASARALLLELIAGSRDSDAEAAFEALAIHRYDAKLVEQVRQAAAKSRVLSQRFAELYLRS